MQLETANYYARVYLPFFKKDFRFAPVKEPVGLRKIHPFIIKKLRWISRLFGKRRVKIVRVGSVKGIQLIFDKELKWLDMYDFKCKFHRTMHNVIAIAEQNYFIKKQQRN